MQWLFTKITDISEAEYEAMYAASSPSRKRHIDRMKHREDRLRSLAAQLLVHRLLGRDAILERAENGKPFLRDSALCVSIAHSYEGVVCAVSEGPVGIDIEKIRSVPPALIDRVCTEGEKAFVLGPSQNCTLYDITRDPREVNFFCIWTAKEAYLKKSGCSLPTALRTDTLALSKEVFFRDAFVITLM